MDVSTVYDVLILLLSFVTVILLGKKKPTTVIATMLLVTTTIYITLKYGLPRALLNIAATTLLVIVRNRVIDRNTK